MCLSILNIFALRVIQLSERNKGDKDTRRYKINVELNWLKNKILT